MRDPRISQNEPCGAMETPRFAYFLRTLVFPRISENLICECPETSLLSRLSEAKEKHGELVSRVTVDNYGKKFWIEAGTYKNITTFKGRYSENEKGSFVRGSFINSGTWISYPFLLFTIFSLVYFLSIKQDTQKMVGYFIFSIIFHLSILISFNIHTTNIIKFMNDRLEIRLSRS